MFEDPEKAIASLPNTIRMTEKIKSEKVSIFHNKCCNKPSLNICVQCTNILSPSLSGNVECTCRELVSTHSLRQDCKSTAGVFIEIRFSCW